MSEAEFSDIVGAIYDCVIAPDHWPDTLRRIGEATACGRLSRMVVQMDGSAATVLHDYNIDPEWTANYKVEYAIETVQLFQQGLNLYEPPFDTPFVLSRTVPRQVYKQQAVFKEWAAPQGLCDTMAAIAVANDRSIASVIAMRMVEDGLIPDESIAVMTLMLPHPRRALTISDLLAQTALERKTLQASIDVLGFAVVIVDAAGRVIESNAAAKAMLDAEFPVAVRDGLLCGTEPNDTRALREAIEAAARHETTDML